MLQKSVEILHKYHFLYVYKKFYKHIYITDIKFENNTKKSNLQHVSICCPPKTRQNIHII